MDFSMTIERLAAIVAVVGSLITALATFIASRNQTKESDASVSKSRLFAPIDAAERINTISLNVSKQLEQQLNECVARRDELTKLLNEEFEHENVSKVKLRKLVSRLRTVREKHDKLYSDTKSTCPGYELLNEMIDSIITDIETELEEN